MATPTTGSGIRLSFAEYEALGEDAPGERWELDEGELIVSPSPVFGHNAMRDALCARLREYEAGRGGIRVVSETDSRLGEGTVRRPDISVFRAERLAGLDLFSWPMPVPDVAIEIVSRNDRADQLMKKVRQYLGAGAEAVWLLYPGLGLAHRYGAADQAPGVYTATAGQSLEEPDLLPGFSAPLQGIFAAAG